MLSLGSFLPGSSTFSNSFRKIFNMSSSTSKPSPSSPAHSSSPTKRNRVATSPEDQVELARKKVQCRRESFVPIDKDQLRKLHQRRVDPGSLNGRLRQHQGLSLYTRPIVWTDVHSRLLGVRFRALPDPVPAHTTDGAPSTTFSRCARLTSLHRRRLATAICAVINKTDKGASDYFHIKSMVSVLTNLFPGVFSSRNAERAYGLSLHYGDARYGDMVNVQALWYQPNERRSDSHPTVDPAANGDGPDDFAVSFCSSAPHLTANGLEAFPSPVTPPASPPASVQSPKPMLAYMGCHFIRTLRSSPIRPPTRPKGPPNNAVSRLIQLRTKMLQPACTDEDAYIASIFISMAQQYFGFDDMSQASESLDQRDQQDRPEPRLEDTTLHLLCEDRECFRFTVYSAVVNSNYILQFHNPNRQFVDPVTGELPSMVIEYVKVPFLPAGSLHQRLGRALGPDVVGEEIDLPPRTPDTDRVQNSDTSNSEISWSPSNKSPNGNSPGGPSASPSRKRKHAISRDTAVKLVDHTDDGLGHPPLRADKKCRVSQ